MKIERAFLLSCLLLAGCRSFRAEAPQGFAVYDGGSAYRAVSSDGVMYRVREVDNEPEADLPFWREALKKRMLDAGYVFVSDGDVKARTSDGYLLELAAPFGQQDFTYLVAVFRRGKELVLVEASGEVATFAGAKAAVLEAIGKLEI